MASKVIGIVSYFPEDERVVKMRILRLENLLYQLNSYGPDIPIFIIAQNGKNRVVKNISSNVVIFSYEKLGILGARNELRNKFLESLYDYLIMFDDDISISMTKQDAQTYMEEIDKHPKGFCFLKYENTQLSMCAISRGIYMNNPMIQLDAEKGEGFEDEVFARTLHYKYPQLEFFAPKGIKCLGFMDTKAPSTWGGPKAQQHYKKMRSNTVTMIEEAKKKYNNTKKCITLGTFDVLHYGHVRLLKRAKEMCGYLIVGLSSDDFAKAKGKIVIDDYDARKEVLESISYVDEVFCATSFENEKEWILKYKPDLFVIGDDYTGKFDYLKEYGIEVIYLPRTPNISSRDIRERIE